MSVSLRLKEIARQVPMVEASYAYLKDYCSLATRMRNQLHREQNIAMFHTGRSGSTVLGEMLSRHSEVCWGGEVLGRMDKRYRVLMKRPDPVRSIIEHSCYARKSKIYGFETAYLPQQHLREEWINMELEEYVGLLRQIGFSKFIVLHRNNYLRKLVSLLVANKNNELHTTREIKRATKIEINIEACSIGKKHLPLLELFRTADASFSRLKSILPKDKSIFLFYEEDILQDPEIAYEKICDFTGIKKESPHVRLKRTNAFSLEDIIQNIDEVKALLAPTQYSWMLED